MKPETGRVLAVVMAAGKGVRLRGDGPPVPKTLREFRGRTFLDSVLDALGFLSPEDIAVVVGYRREQVMAAAQGRCRFCVQEEQLGTGHAVACAASLMDARETVLVCTGDMPLLRRSTLLAMLEQHSREGNDCTMLTGTLPGGQTLGRVLRSPDGRFGRVVEFRDCDEAQRAVTEYNAGVYCFRTEPLRRALPRLKNANASGEYYLTDALPLLAGDGGRIGIYYTQNPGEIAGINTQEELGVLEALDTGL